MASPKDIVNEKSSNEEKKLTNGTISRKKKRSSMEIKWGN